MTKTKNNRSQAMREARRQRSLTQFDLARRVGCSESLISKIETGRTAPESWLREGIAKELGIQSWEVGV